MNALVLDKYGQWYYEYSSEHHNYCYCSAWRDKVSSQNDRTAKLTVMETERSNGNSSSHLRCRLSMKSAEVLLYQTPVQPPLPLSSVTERSADCLSAAWQEGRRVVRQEFATELGPGRTLLLSLAVRKSDVFTSQMTNKSIKTSLTGQTWEWCRLIQESEAGEWIRYFSYW